MNYILLKVDANCMIYFGNVKVTLEKCNLACQILIMSLFFSFNIMLFSFKFFKKNY